MDLDAILRRQPKLVLIDELAHTNAPGSRHPKRYMDVEELLAAGMNVYTTLNVQHVESLNDVVAKITRIRVREQVPDSIVDQADNIELVDLTPDDLIQRLAEGKVYVPLQAQRAVRNYFRPGNLTALRELALRRTAQRVDEQMVTYMQAHAIPGPWAANERVLVCVSENPSCAAVVRHARRLADRLRAPWTAIHLDTAPTQRLGERARDRIADCLRLAQRLGGEAVTVPGTNIATDIVEYARANNFTHIIVAKSRRPRWSLWWGGSVTHQLIRRAGDIGVHVIDGEDEQTEPGDEPVETAAPRGSVFEFNSYAGTVGIVAAALGVGLILQQFLRLPTSPWYS